MNRELFMIKRKTFVMTLVVILILASIPALNTSASTTGGVIDAVTSEVVDKITTHNITTGDDKDLAQYNEFYAYVPADTKELIVPITLENKGILVCNATLPTSANESGSGYIGIYADSTCQGEDLYSSYDNSAIIPKAGTYYIKFYVYDSDNLITHDTYAFDFVSQFYNGGNQTLKNNQIVCAGIVDETHPIYYKITASKAGSLTINTNSSYGSYITLVNSNKKPISDKCYVYSGSSTTCFSVPKGTYYIKVISFSDYMYLKPTFKALSDTSGATKAKAKKLTIGKLTTGNVLTSDKKGKTDWYKITLTKEQKVNIKFAGSVSSGKIQLEFFGNNISGSIVRTISTVESDQSFNAQTYTSSTLPKGTYYIKVTKLSTNTSGFYQLKYTK